MKSLSQQPDSLEAQYKHRYDQVLVRLADGLGMHIIDCLEGQKRIDRVSARAKDVSSFVKKARTFGDGKLKYDDPLSQIQD